MRACRAQRMVYPEQLAIDTVDGKAPEAAGSWCGGPLQPASQGSVAARSSAGTAGTVADVGAVENGNPRTRSSRLDHRPNTSTKRFIQERVRHLVDAFSNRTNTIKKHLDLPPTPSSHSSQEDGDAGPPSKGIGKPSNVAQISSESKLDGDKSSTLDFIRNYYLNTVVDPQSSSYLVWLFVVAVVYVYNCWTVPLRSSFPSQTPNNRVVWMVFDYISDIIYILDLVVVKPRVIYIDDGFWIRDVKQTKQNYLKSAEFKIDLVALLPLDLFYFIFGPDMVILRLPRLIKIHAFWNLFENIDKLLPSPHIVRIIRTLMYMMYLIHLNGCAYYAFSEWEGIGSNTFVYHGRGNAYLRCFYFGTKTVTSIGKNPKPKKNIELVFMTVLWLKGVFVSALIIGQFRDIIATASRNQTEYRKLVDDTMEYLRMLNLPLELQKRIKTWFEYTWMTQHTLDENSILNCLPQKMKTDIAISVHINTLGKVKLFADCDEALLRELVLKLRSVIYLPKELICRKGDVGHEMYILQSGQVEVVAGNGVDVLATLSEGSVFGEISLLGIAGLNRRTADVRSKGYSNLFVLNKTDLNEALAIYPDAQDILNKKAKALVRKNASLERAKNQPVIVIDNPEPRARLLDTVLQVVPYDSKTNKLLRYGSKGRPRTAAAVRQLINNFTPNMIMDSAETSFQCDVTVHREMK